MHHCIDAIFERLSRLTRSTKTVPIDQPTTEATTPVVKARCSPPGAAAPAVVRGEDITMVRPYLIAHEKGREPQQERLTAGLTAPGIDTGANPPHEAKAAVR